MIYLKPLDALRAFSQCRFSYRARALTLHVLVNMTILYTPLDPLSQPIHLAEPLSFPLHPGLAAFHS